MGVWASTGVGHYQASERSFGVANRMWKGDQSSRGLLYCPGLGATALTFMQSPHDPVPRALAEAGVPSASFDFGGSALFGNDTARTRVGTARTYANTTWGWQTDKVLLIGGSMGGMTALRWALANPSLVAAIALFIPLVDVQDLYDNDRGGYASDVETAYGARPSDAQNPADNADDLAGIPIKVWSSSDDDLCLQSTHGAFCTASGAELVDLGAVGHNFDSAEYADDVADFLLQHA